MKKTVLVYKTNVENHSKAQLILDEINRAFPESESNFDLDDCDNVLRIEHPAENPNEEKILQILKNKNVQADSLL